MVQGNNQISRNLLALAIPVSPVVISDTYRFFA